MYLRFWGTRGSIPQPGAGTVRYGGNTPCIELRSDAGTLVVLDCGTGAHALGRDLMAGATSPLAGHLLITHTHWDHIQGFPFFQPLFAANGTWDIYGPHGLGQSLSGTLAGQQQYAYFPVSLDQLAATQRYHELVEGYFEVGDIRVTTRFVNHPALTLAYRLEVDGVVMVYATDHEPHARELAAGLTTAPHGEDARHGEFLAGADLLIHDAQYRAIEYPRHIGWGHSTVEYAVDMAARAGVRRLALFHHDPWRDDAAVDQLVAAARARAGGLRPEMEVLAAAEGLVLRLTSPRTGGPSRAAPPSPQAVVPSAEIHHTVLVATDDDALGATLTEAGLACDCAVTRVRDGAAALPAARGAAPSLVLVDMDLAPAGGLGTAQALRFDPTTCGADVPIVMVADRQLAPAVWAGEAVGVTDWLVQPFSSAYARARIQAWVLRASCRWHPAPPPPDEAVRLAAVRGLGLLDTPAEERFDRLTRMASRLLNVPISTVTLVDGDRQWFKSCQGLEARQTPRDVAFCAHAILADGPFVVRDALLDDRFADNPVVTGGPRVRFYAGVPLRTSTGSRVGTFCIIDHRPRELDDDALQVLMDLAALAESELRRSVLGTTEPA